MTSAQAVSLSGTACEKSHNQPTAANSSGNQIRRQSHAHSLLFCLGVFLQHPI
ncbi:MAG: hypothetical protein NWE96_11395 [Candidatus Bathyarchaeota archaeon]|nr:hypothetical protein [Candidatus Bathyarchaeota archaeon]